MKTSEILTGAADLITKGWTQQSGARDENENKVEIESPLAVKFCLVGAIQRVAPNEEEAHRARQAARTACLYDSIIQFNDFVASSADDVVKVLLDAATEERARDN